MIALTLLLSLLLGVQGQLNFLTTKNISVTPEWSFRAIDSWDVSPPLIRVYGTSALAVDLSSGGLAANADGVITFTAAGTGIPPTLLLAYFEAGAQIAQSLKSLTNPFGFDFTVSGGLMGMLFDQLEEIDGAASVRTFDLTGTATNTWSFAQQTYPSGIRAGIFTYRRSLNAGFSLTITVVSSAVTGILDYPGEPVLVPKAVEALVEIKGFPYAKPTNTLKLTVRTAAATASKSFGTFGSGKGATFIHFSKVARVENTTLAPVKVLSTPLFGSSFGNAVIEALLKAKFGASLSLGINFITFPAGANLIQYDPALGSGTNPNPKESAANSFTALWSLLLAALLFASL